MQSSLLNENPGKWEKIMKKKKLQALFFDFDGVIIDSARIKTEGFRTLFDSFSDQIVDKIVDYHQQHGGISRVDKIAYAFQNFIKQPLSQAELDLWSTRYSDLVVEKVIDAQWIAGAKEFLEEMHGKIPIFVISGTPETELRYVLKKRLISFYFQEILGSPMRKPQHIRNLLRQYFLNPDQCVFVGDALTDYNAAKDTGLHFVGIQGENKFPRGTTVLDNCNGLLQSLMVCVTC